MSHLDFTALDAYKGITLYSHHDDFRSHVVRFLLAEKGIDYRLILLNEPHHDDLTLLNPYAKLPTLVDNQVKLFQLNVICEYLDERYRQQSVFADTPSEKAEQRQYLWRIEQDWLKLADCLLMHPDRFDEIQASKAKQELRDTLTSLEPLFQHYPFFMAEQFSMIDCLLAPLLLRLWAMQMINLRYNQALSLYSKRLFLRHTFQKSLTALEQQRYAGVLKQFMQ